MHDWLLSVGGAEKVLRALHEMFPTAPVYVLLHNKKFTRRFLPGAEIRSSFLQKAYQILHSHWLLMPFLPLAVESLDLSKFELVISSSAFAKGLILKPQTAHINYCCSPIRQVWDWSAEYGREPHRLNRGWVMLFQHFLRIWDRHASTRVDQFIVISENVRRRVKKYYQREAAVIYPPVDAPVDAVEVYNGVYASRHDRIKTHTPYFLIVSRLYRHKNVHLAVKAFSKLEWPLVVIGDGPELNRLRRLANRSADIASHSNADIASSPRGIADIASHSNADIVFLGYQPDEVVRQYYADCLAFVMPQEEDFGLTPIEAMSYGKPVLALKRGGALEYIKEGINGEFFEDPTEEMLADGARRLKENLASYDPETIKKTAERFSKERFKNEMANLMSLLF